MENYLWTNNNEKMTNNTDERSFIETSNLAEDLCLEL